MYPFERFSENSKAVLTLAQAQAERAHHSYIGTEHLLLGLMEEEQGLAGAALRNMGLQLADLERDVATALRNAPHESGSKQIIPTSRVKRIIELAFGEAQREGMSQVETSHLLVALLLEGHGIGAQVLVSRGVTAERVYAEIAELRGTGKAESVAAGPPLTRRHIALTDETGKQIGIDILFPAEYTAERQNALTNRIRNAVEGGGGSSQGQEEAEKN
ncbi:MAG: ATP-dependent Clp protease ATP-binding subunit [Chloroflexi bacterium]|nr:MAG: ATP-dependent Clp protease ATP-binding subunit [Chloroflexota bacterium]TME45403.1 MAG: ATP-dependent Clp protease ATP-binding subunit [Chloroflexota bacterium]